MPTWPELPSFSGSNFLDHFDSTLDARWTSVTSGTGAVTITDSYLKCDSPTNSAAFVYYNTKLDKTKSQLWMICVAEQTGNTAGAEGPLHICVVNGSSAPTADTTTNIVAKTLIRRVFDASDTSLQDEHWSSGSVRNWWNPATPAWETGFASSIPDARPDDYYIVALEIDARNQRWRLLGLSQSFATANVYEFDQGWRLFSLTDWVTWTNTRSNSDLWLILGNPYNNLGVTREMRIEWVRYAQCLTGNLPVDAWVAQKSSFTAEDHRIKHLYSYDGVGFIPQDRTTWALDTDANDDALQSPRVCQDPTTNTDYMFYSAYDGASWRISVASAARERPQNGPWTKYVSNPIIPLGGAGSDDENRTDRPAVVCDLTESDANKRWKMLYVGEKASDNKNRILYATAPAALGPWTKQGTVINVGAGGSKDESECSYPAIVHYGDMWEVWYEGRDASNVEYLLRATGTDLASLTKDTTDYTASVPSASQSLTANLSAAPGRTVTVADTSNFVKDAAVVFSQSTTMDDYGYSKIRKIVSGTVIELYHGITGFATTYPAKIKQMNAARTRSPRQIVRVGSEWWFYTTIWEPFYYTADQTSYNPGCEETHLWTSSNDSPSGAIASIQYQPSPVNWRGFNNDQRSSENITLINTPYSPQAVIAWTVA